MPIVVCDLETSRMRRPWPALGRSATEIYIYIYIYIYNRNELRFRTANLYYVKFSFADCNLFSRTYHQFPNSMYVDNSWTITSLSYKRNHAEHASISTKDIKHKAACGTDAKLSRSWQYKAILKYTGTSIMTGDRSLHLGAQKQVFIIPLPWKHLL